MRSSLKSRVTSQRRLYYIAQQMGKRITADMLVALGERGISNCPVNEYWQYPIQEKEGVSLQRVTERGDWDTFERLKEEGRIFRGDGEPSSAEKMGGFGAADTVKLDYGTGQDGKLGPHRLVDMEKAKDFLKQRAFRYLSQYQVKFRAIGTYRAFIANEKAKRIVGRNYARAMGALRLATYAQSRRLRGQQRISTRNEWWGKQGAGIVVGLHAGHIAFKRPQGRPPLSEAEWMRRYRARLEKRRKTQRKSPRKGVKIPVTKSRRDGPRFGDADKYLPPVQSHKPAQGPFGNVESPDWLDEAMEGAVMDALNDLARDFGKELAETGKEWVEVLWRGARGF